MYKEDIKVATKEVAALSLKEIPGVPMEVGAASKSVVQYFPSTLNSDDVLGKFCTADFDAAPTSIETPGISFNERVAASLAATFISSLFNVRGRGYLLIRSGKFCGYYYC